MYDDDKPVKGTDQMIRDLELRIGDMERNVQFLVSEHQELKSQVSSLEPISSADIPRRLSALESEMAHLRPRRNEDPKTISPSHPDAGDPDWFPPEAKEHIGQPVGGRKSGKTEEARRKRIKMISDEVLRKANERIRRENEEARRKGFDPTIAWYTSQTPLVPANDGPPYTLSYQSASRMGSSISRTEELSHAHTLAQAFANAKGVAVRIRDRNGNLICEKKPGELVS